MLPSRRWHKEKKKGGAWPETRAKSGTERLREFRQVHDDRESQALESGCRPTRVSACVDHVGVSGRVWIFHYPRRKKPGGTGTPGLPSWRGVGVKGGQARIVGGRGLRGSCSQRGCPLCASWSEYGTGRRKGYMIRQSRGSWGRRMQCNARRRKLCARGVGSIRPTR